MCLCSELTRSVHWGPSSDCSAGGGAVILPEEVTCGFMQLPQCTVCTPQAANWIRTTVWNSMFAYVFHWFLYEPVGQHTTTMRLAYNNWCHFRRCVCHEQLLTMKWELMLLPNHSHHDCPGCPSEFHQRACCCGGGGSAAGTLGTFFRPPNNYASGVIHSFLLCSSSFVRLLMYGSASVQAMGGQCFGLWPRGFWKPCRGQSVLQQGHVF